MLSTFNIMLEACEKWKIIQMTEKYDTSKQNPIITKLYPNISIALSF